MVRIDWTADARLADRPGRARTARSRSTRRPWRCTTARRSSRGSRPTASPTARSRPSGRSRTRHGSHRSARPAGDARAPGGAVPGVAARAGRRSTAPGCPADRDPVAVPAAIHDRDRGRPRRAAVANAYTYLLIASPAGAYFPRGVQAGVGLAVHRIHPRRSGRHRRGEVRAATTRRSLVAQAYAAEQGCDQVVWLDAVEHRWVEEMGGMNLYFVYGSGPSAPHRDPRAHRHPAARRHPRLAAHPGPGARLRAPRRARSPPTSGARATRPARSPRSSPAAPPR